MYNEEGEEVCICNLKHGGLAAGDGLLYQTLNPNLNPKP